MGGCDRRATLGHAPSLRLPSTVRTMSTVWGAGDYAVISATLFQPRPLLRTPLPLETGLSVLYGRNGAGKSRALEALQAAITGERGRSWAWLHLRVLPTAGVVDGLI